MCILLTLCNQIFMEFIKPTSQVEPEIQLCSHMCFKYLALFYLIKQAPSCKAKLSKCPYFTLTSYIKCLWLAHHTQIITSSLSSYRKFPGWVPDEAFCALRPNRRKDILHANSALSMQAFGNVYILFSLSVHFTKHRSSSITTWVDNSVLFSHVSKNKKFWLGWTFQKALTCLHSACTPQKYSALSDDHLLHSCSNIFYIFECSLRHTPYSLWYVIRSPPFCIEQALPRSSFAKCAAKFSQSFVKTISFSQLIIETCVFSENMSNLTTTTHSQFFPHHVQSPMAAFPAQQLLL